MTSNPLAPSWLAVPSDANALAPRVWSHNSLRDLSGELVIGGVSASAIAAQFGTPVYVVDEADARSRARGIRLSFDREFARVGGRAKVYYAGKAFLSIEVARWMNEAGLNIDVASGGELAVALAAGVDPAHLGLHGNNKSPAEIDRAVSIGIGAIVIDSEIEIARVAAAAAHHGRRQSVRLRINSGVHASTHEYLATAREDQKFGIPLVDAAALVALIRAEPALEFLGLHSHIGSQIFESSGFAEAARRLLALHAELLADGPVPELNLGGGFGIAYTSVDEPLSIDEIAARFADIVSEGAAELGIPVPVVAIEPGRSIIGPSTTTLYTVGTIKDVLVAGTAVRKYVSVDGGMSDNIRPSLYRAEYSVRLANRSSTAPAELVRIAGKHCESGDIVVHADYLPGDVASGDLVGVPATGAYGWAMASNYNYLGRPPVVAVVDGLARIIVRGETEEDLLRRDAGVRVGSAKGAQS
ncbi:diaminopimelate decarboxylase [Salinibacterium sp.]|uniref:diaminopimelate decarboxylase n=1 Tax=Salinibacterium sp. TaxID=1915057 RepID=UPI00286B70DF|nr:diaminopimelate decarboxylase [Salinibacterium sp.]